MKFEKSKPTKAPVSNTVKTVGTANRILHNSIYGATAKEVVKPVYVAPAHDTVNTQGRGAYSKDVFTTLLTLLNTLKLDGDQFYRSENQAFKDVKAAVKAAAQVDPYFTAQCLRYSRVDGEALRSVNHLAATFLSEYLSGKDYAKYVYSRYNTKTKIGGIVRRIDDMIQIANAYFAVTENAKALPNSLRKGFQFALETADAYELGKYRSRGMVDIINLVHPDANKSTAIVEVDGDEYRKVLNAKLKATKNASKKLLYQTKLLIARQDKTVKIKALDAIVLGITYAVDTHEVRNSEAGQIVAEAKKAGKISEKEAVEMLATAKNENFKEQLQNGKLGVLACIRNLANMTKNGVDAETIKLVESLLTNAEAVRKSMVHPMQIDIAYEFLNDNFSSNSTARSFMLILQKSFENALVNAKLNGRVAVFVDMSGSMGTPMFMEGTCNSMKAQAIDKACLIAAVYAKSCNADVYAFDNYAKAVSYDPTKGVFDLAKQIKKSYGGGGTSISAPFELVTRNNKAYDKIILLSDNEANSGSATSRAAANYFNKVGVAMVYAVDLAAYGTAQLKGSNVFELYGYGFSMFEDMAKREYDPNAHLTEVAKVRFKDKNV